MELKEYFDNSNGHGILATADASGNVDAAMYARPHFMEDDTLAFIMAERLTHANLQSNPKAAYLFIESGAGYTGRRLYLTKVREVEDDGLISEICRRCDYSMYQDNLTRHVVFFKLDCELPLVGSGN